MVEEDLEVAYIEDTVGVDVAEQITVRRLNTCKYIVEQYLHVEVVDGAIGVEVEPERIVSGGFCRDIPGQAVRRGGLRLVDVVVAV